MKILVADDDPLTLEAVCTCLTDDGFSAVPARHGAEALELWGQHRPSLLCLDIMMPKMDGYEVCRRIRASDAAVPILFLSAKNEEIDVVVGLELGADDFIRKPFGKRELLARVRAALRRRVARKGVAAVSFTLLDLTVFPDELRAVRGGQSIELTPREVSMLRLLHENAGCPVHRDTFLDRCWGMDYYPESRTLDQHIAQLRRKIEVNPATPVIVETVRGVGYRYRPAEEGRF
ncbi:MAG TPA: response regulator transcription factor [Verrucomicrobiales bacterium]|jgi:DNA-binding response OmpR family regulator|nr:response regulator transcription factor [Verrucomicrobiales bacterium]